MSVTLLDVTDMNIILQQFNITLHKYRHKREPKDVPYGQRKQYKHTSRDNSNTAS